MATRKNLKGGFYPSVMVGVSQTGPYFVTAAIAQGVRLVRNNKSRMARRKQGRRRSKRSKRS
ncbi:hypothetical protein EBR66_03195 [bacterium]|nr:hypothetical protein [bacterium]